MTPGGPDEEDDMPVSVEDLKAAASRMQGQNEASQQAAATRNRFNTDRAFAMGQMRDSGYDPDSWRNRFREFQSGTGYGPMSLPSMADAGLNINKLPGWMQNGTGMDGGLRGNIGLQGTVGVRPGEALPDSYARAYAAFGGGPTATGSAFGPPAAPGSPGRVGSPTQPGFTSGRPPLDTGALRRVVGGQPRSRVGYDDGKFSSSPRLPKIGKSPSRKIGKLPYQSKPGSGTVSTMPVSQPSDTPWHSLKR